jgi:excinuclease ABC subunit C
LLEDKWFPLETAPLKSGSRTVTDEETEFGFEEEGAAYEAGAAPTGPEVIRAYLPTLPDAPGVYRMLDRRSAVLYVGKARSLRKRVANYANGRGHSARIGRMIAATAAMMFVTTETETEALLLEANLIKQLKPRFNVLLRDDKSFPHILIGGDHPFPQLRKHRGLKATKGRYFGPFASAGRGQPHHQHAAEGVPAAHLPRQRVRQPHPPLPAAPDQALLRALRRLCLRGGIRRAGRRDALSGRPLHPGAGDAGRADERGGGQHGIRARRRLRDRIRALTAVQANQGVNPESVEEADVVALHQEGGQACVQVFFFRSNQNWGNRAYFPRTGSGAGAGGDPGGLPRPVLRRQGAAAADPALPRPARRGAARRGAERSRRAQGDAGDAEARREEGSGDGRAAQRPRVAGAAHGGIGLAGAAARLAGGGVRSRRPAARIEVYDNSHIMGAHAVGAMIVAGPEGFEKNQYRKFNIKSDALTPGDDFGMMREVLTRRFARLLKEDPDRDKGAWPDLVLIDGGAGQVSAAVEALDEMGVEDVALVGVAKGLDRDAGKEEFHKPGRRPFALPHRDPTLYFVQRLRDEAHRFAIGAHRAKRAKATTQTPLDDAPGIGPARKRALLAHFGSAKAVARAGVEDLKAVEGINARTAEALYAFFHGAA